MLLFKVDMELLYLTEHEIYIAKFTYVKIDNNDSKRKYT